jgi:hypothetical protein
MPKKNIGTGDRLFRLLLALILFLFAWWQTSWILLGLGIFTLYESLASWCAFYQLMGKNTCSINSIDKP